MFYFCPVTMFGFALWTQPIVAKMHKFTLSKPKEEHLTNNPKLKDIKEREKTLYRYKLCHFVEFIANS